MDDDVAVESYCKRLRRLGRRAYPELLAMLSTSTVSIVVFSIAIPLVTAFLTAVFSAHQERRTRYTSLHY
jgi:hypothetical protein